MMLGQLEALVQAGKQAGYDAIGMSPVIRKTSKFDGVVIEITPFKLSSQK